MRPTLTLRFDTQPDLAATMDIQIPALAWQPTGDGRFRRLHYVDGAPVEVHAAQGRNSLRFFYDTDPHPARQLRRLLTAAFATPVANLALDTHPALKAMREHYQGVIVMTAPPFEALVLTILSQNRTGEIVRQVYPRLAAATCGVAPDQLAALPVDRLTELIRSAGPYKGPRLAATAATVADLGEDAFDQLVRQPGPQALAFLQALPGVAHKTAACVLV